MMTQEDSEILGNAHESNYEIPEGGLPTEALAKVTISRRQSGESRHTADSRDARGISRRDA